MIGHDENQLQIKTAVVRECMYDAVFLTAAFLLYGWLALRYLLHQADSLVYSIWFI